jgi:Cu/Ag efflux pump CusA
MVHGFLALGGSFFLSPQHRLRERVNSTFRPCTIGGPISKGSKIIRCYFDWDTDYNFDRTQTINQLTFVTLPQGTTPGISPENPVGEIYRYSVESPDHDLLRQKEIEDWVLEKQLKTVPGVIDVTGFGGLTKQYQVEVDPQRLTYYQVPLATLASAIANANTNAVARQPLLARPPGSPSTNDIKGSG